MGNASSTVANESQARTADSVSKEINEIIIKLRDARQRLDNEKDNAKKNIIIREITLLVSTQASLNDELDELQAAVAPAAAALAPAAAVAPAAAASFNTPNTQQFYNARNAPGPQGHNQQYLSGFEYPSSDSDSVDSIGGTIKRKNSKRKNSKRKNSKRKNSKRKNSKRKNSKRKNSKRKNSKRK
jgi:hypothetical protein